MAWLDPMCGLMLAFAAAVALWARRRSGIVARVDFSMIEAMLWTMAEPILATKPGTPPQPRGNTDPSCEPHDIWRCAGEDEWLAVAVRTAEEVRALARLLGTNHAGPLRSELAAWCMALPAKEAWAKLRDHGIPAAILARSGNLAESNHLRARRFWDPHGQGTLPGLPWHASFGRRVGAAPTLGADTERTLSEVAKLSRPEIARLTTMT